MSAPLEIAMEHIRRGRAPVPIPDRKKGPVIKEWESLRITAAEAPRYFNGEAQNVGVILGEASGGLVDADLDCPQAIRVAGEMMPPTESVFGRPGRPFSHRIYRCAAIDPETGVVQEERCETAQFRDPTDRAMLVELRGDGGFQTVFPGSTHESGEPIEWASDGDPGLVRAAVLQRLFRELAAVAMLAKHLPEPKQRDAAGNEVGGGRHDANLKLAGWLTRSGWPEERVATFIDRVNRAAGEDRGKFAKRQALARDAAQRLKSDGVLYGWTAFVELFGEKVAGKAAEWLQVKSEHPKIAAPADDWETKLEAAIVEMNTRYFVTGVGGRGVIGSLVHDDALDRERLVFSRKDDVKLRFSHRHYVVGLTQKGNPIWRGLGDAWLDDWRRRTFDRIALLPDRATPPGVYNLWRGWGIEPKAGAWPLIHDHLLDVICAGDQGHYDYLEGWLACCIQRPERQAEVAVVLRGLKGTGKGTLGQMLVRIFRDHALHIMNSRHLTGHFNAHLADALFLFLDEAFWGGDKQGEGVLKALITERTLMIEPKGVDPFTMPNRLKILMASNADWIVPASADERRYLVLDVSDHRRGDHGYFDALHAAMDGAELPAFLHHLRAYDLAGYKIRAVPHTKGLNSQKLIGADSVTKFWHDCLNEGAILGEGSYLWPAVDGPGVVTQVLHACYVDHARQHGERFPDSAELLCKRLNQLWAGCDTHRHRPRCPWTDPQGNAIDRPQRYRLGTLEEHREAFLKAMQIDPGDHEWPTVRGDDR